MIEPTKVAGARISKAPKEPRGEDKKNLLKI